MKFKLEITFSYPVTRCCGGHNTSRSKSFEANTDEQAKDKAIEIINDLIKDKYQYFKLEGEKYELDSVKWKLTKTVSENSHLFSGPFGDKKETRRVTRKIFEKDVAA